MSIASRVVPACSSTITRSWPRNAFTSDDLPTFGRPITASRTASSAVLLAPASPRARGRAPRCGRAGRRCRRREPPRPARGSPRPSSWNSAASGASAPLSSLFAATIDRHRGAPQDARRAPRRRDARRRVASTTSSTARRVVERQPRLLLDLPRERRARPRGRLRRCRRAANSTPFHSAGDLLAVAGHAGLRMRDRLARAAQPVDERRLADVRDSRRRRPSGGGRGAHRSEARARCDERERRARPPASAVEARGVDLDRVVGRAQRRRRAGRVEPVALLDRRAAPHPASACDPAPLELGRAPARPLVRIGGQEHLHRRVGSDDGADVAALDDVVAGGDQLALLARAAPRAPRGCAATVELAPVTRGGADLLAHVAPVERSPARCRRRARAARSSRPAASRPSASPSSRSAPASSAASVTARYMRAGVQVGEAEPARERARDRALAAAGGPVDRDDHRRKRRGWR